MLCINLYLFLLFDLGEEQRMNLELKPFCRFPLFSLVQFLL